jgi:hypothetical protein
MRSTSYSTRRYARREFTGVIVTSSPTAADPLTLVISDDIYRTIVRHGYDGIDPQAFSTLIRVYVAGHRYPGWVYAARRTAQLQMAEIGSYNKQPA